MTVANSSFSSIADYIRQNPVLSKAEVHYHWGRLNKPLIILVHGYALCKKSWMDPMYMSLGKNAKDALCHIRFTTQNGEQTEDYLRETLPSGSFLFSAIERSNDKELSSFWKILSDSQFSLVTWNQRYPNDEVRYALEELEEIYKLIKLYGLNKEIILLCHSRGGLIARKFLQLHPEVNKRIKALIMLGTPNQGSMLATFAEKFARFEKYSNFLRLARRFLPPALQKKEILQDLLLYIKYLLQFFKNKAITEMKSTSPFIVNLKKQEVIERENTIPYYHLIGIHSQYDKVYFSSNKQDHFVEVPLYYTKLPEVLLPWEMINGKGDGLVAIHRAKLGFEKVFEKFWANHNELLIDSKVQSRVLEIIQTLGK